MECNYLSFSDNGEQLKELMSDFETRLIDQKILVDKSGSSYQNAVSQIASGIELKQKPTYSFMSQMNGLERRMDSTSINCQIKVLSDSTKYDSSKFIKFQKTIENIINSSGDLRPEIMADGITEVLSAKDFELEFYKLRAFLLFDMLSQSNELDRKASNKPKYESDNAFKIYLNSENKLYVDEIEIKFKSLKSELIAYYKENKSKSVVSIKTDKETMYTEYIAVQNEIISAFNAVRDILSNQKFGKNYNELNEINKKSIEEEFPQNIVSE